MTRPPESAPRRVAVVANSLHAYQSKILCGIRDALRRKGLECTVLLGGLLRDPSAEVVRANDVYDFIDPQNFCGVIVLSVAVGLYVTDDDLGEWIQGFGGLPVVSIGRTIAGASNILIDNRPGMSALMAHLLDSPDCRKLAFIRGVDGNADSEQREAVFRAALVQRGRTIDEGLILAGEFAPARACRAVAELLGRRRDVDAIVCANDEMADGAIQAITAAGLRVPQDIAVVGFDDAVERVLPELTTVRLPIYEQGREAALMLVEMLDDGPKATSNLFIEPQLVVRDSCGGRERHAARLPQDDRVDDGDFNYLLEARQGLLRAFEEMSAHPERHDDFLKLWFDELSQRDLLDLEYTAWREALDSRANREGASPEAGRLARAAAALLERMVQIAGYRRYTLRQDVGQSAPRLFTCEDHDGLLTELPKFLKHVGLTQYALVLYETFQSEPSERARVILDGSGRALAKPPWFRTRDIPPAAEQGKLSSDLLLLAPLFVNATHYGFLLYQPPTWWGPFPDTSFCHTISHAIRQVENTLAARNYSFQLECQVQARTSALEAQVAETMRAEQALRAANVSLQHAAFHDGLTQLYNRAAFNEHFESQWEQHLRQQRPLSLLLCDVDHFKKYNDLHGHVGGDECLRQVAHALWRAVRSQRDIVARYGGEEFVVVLPFTDPSVAARVAERIQQEVLALQLPHGAYGAGQHVTVSIGVATAVPQDGVAKQSLVERADHCLYEAKSAGRARYVSAEAA